MVDPAAREYDQQYRGQEALVRGACAGFAAGPGAAGSPDGLGRGRRKMTPGSRKRSRRRRRRAGRHRHRSRRGRAPHNEPRNDLREAQKSAEYGLPTRSRRSCATAEAFLKPAAGDHDRQLRQAVADASTTSAITSASSATFRISMRHAAAFFQAVPVQRDHNEWAKEFRARKRQKRSLAIKAQHDAIVSE